jgi:hypothetical protein
VSPLISSIYGGSRLIIRGHDFSKTLSDRQVMIDQNPCTLLNATQSELQCLIPPQETSSNLSPLDVSSTGIAFLPRCYLNYSVDITLLISVVRINQINLSLQITITGSIVAHLESVGNSNASLTYRRDLQINGSSPDQGSFGGGLLVTIIGDGFAGDNITATVCDQPCLSINI